MSLNGTWVCNPPASTDQVPPHLTPLGILFQIYMPVTDTSSETHNFSMSGVAAMKPWLWSSLTKPFKFLSVAQPLRLAPWVSGSFHFQSCLCLWGDEAQPAGFHHPALASPWQMHSVSSVPCNCFPQFPRATAKLQIPREEVFLQGSSCLWDRCTPIYQEPLLF